MTDEAMRIQALKDIGCRPENHPTFYTADLHLMLQKLLHERHRQSLEQYIPQPAGQKGGV